MGITNALAIRVQRRCLREQILTISAATPTRNETIKHPSQVNIKIGSTCAIIVSALDRHNDRTQPRRADDVNREAELKALSGVGCSDLVRRSSFNPLNKLWPGTCHLSSVLCGHADKWNHEYPTRNIECQQLASAVGAEAE